MTLSREFLVQAVKRNGDCFPDDFVFQLNSAEFKDLKSQIVISSWGDHVVAPELDLIFMAAFMNPGTHHPDES